MVNVNAQGVRRVIGKYEKGIENVKGSLENYLNTNVEEILKELAEGRTVEEQYVNLITQILGKEMGDSVRIRDEGDKLAYYILGYTRKTQGGSGYSKGFSELKRRLEWADRYDVKRELDKIFGRTKSLDDYPKS